MRILLSGMGGRMGAVIQRLAREGYAGAEVVAGVDVQVQKGEIPCTASFDGACSDVDCVVDFSHHDNTRALLQFAAAHRLPLVLATTGQTEEEREAIREAAREIPLFFAANYSLGIALLIDFAKKAAQALPGCQVEIIEKHHDQKVDAPSGTALAMAEGIMQVRPELKPNCGRSGFGKRSDGEIGIHAIRMGNIVGVHEVILGTPSQTITLKHEAHSRALFGEGALYAAAFLLGKGPGLYTMADLARA